MSNGKVNINESFEKTTEVVVIFKDEKIYKDDCESLRMILGKVFPILLEREEPKEEVMEKWLMRKGFSNELVKDRNLTELEADLRKANILLSYKYADEELIQMIPKEQRIWSNDLYWTYLQDSNNHISNVVDSLEENELISNCIIKFSINTTTVHTSQEDITGNYFSIVTKSRNSEEALKIGHKRIVQSLLEVLEPIDEIEKISYYCGDIEHRVESRISCVLD